MEPEEAVKRHIALRARRMLPCRIPQIAVDPACNSISHTLYQRQIDFCNKTCSGPDSCSAEKEPVKFERRFCYLAVRKRDDRQ